MEVGLIRKIDIDGEMQSGYLSYAMSVIASRALPDARDGLKPVQRRILYAMHDMGIHANSAYKKSARIVGEVLGKYHPHGDASVYEAMARMAQDFSMRALLVDGQGNFGSVDGDAPAAMRYTEARLAAPASHMLADIQKNTVDYDPNFDGTLSEPQVLPSAIPNLLVNGATGIAVGMSTSIPPHNMGEVVDALINMLENWEKLDDINLEDIMRFIQGPDFPTGGVIIQESGEEALMSAYGTGRGGVTLQARAHLEEMERGRNRIIVTELPYMTNKASLIERIADLDRRPAIRAVSQKTRREMSLSFLLRGIVARAGINQEFDRDHWQCPLLRSQQHHAVIELDSLGDDGGLRWRCQHRGAKTLRVVEMQLMGLVVPGTVYGDGLEILAPHHRTTAAAARMPGGTLFHVGAGDGRGAQFQLSRRTDGNAGDLLPKFRFHFGDQIIIGKHLQALVATDLHPILVDYNLVGGIVGRFSFEHNRRITQAGKYLGRLTSGIGFFDPPGERALETNREPPGHGRGGAAQHTGSDDHLIVGA